MNTNTRTAINTQVDAGSEASKFALGVIHSSAALLGIWGVASLLSALMSNGPVGLVKDSLMAVTGM